MGLGPFRIPAEPYSEGILCSPGIVLGVCRGVYLTQNAHPRCSSQRYQTSACDAYSILLIQTKVCEQVCAGMWGEVMKINILFLFCLSSTVHFSSKVICAVFSSLPSSSNSLAQFCCCLVLVTHSDEQNYPFATFKALLAFNLEKSCKTA